NFRRERVGVEKEGQFNTLWVFSMGTAMQQQQHLMIGGVRACGGEVAAYCVS
ncbi:hypothetical protein WUBG_11924, partial [Wuchereria bancrofti]